MRRTFLAVMMIGMAVSLAACQESSRTPVENGLRTMETDESFEGTAESEGSWVRYMLVSAEDKSVRPIFSKRRLFLAVGHSAGSVTGEHADL